MNSGDTERYLTASRNPEGRERLLTLAASLDEPSIAEEIRLCRYLCGGLLVLLAAVLGAQFLF